MRMRELIQIVESAGLGSHGLSDTAATNIRTLSDINPEYADLHASLTDLHHGRGEDDATHRGISLYKETSSWLTTELMRGGGKLPGGSEDGRDAARRIKS